MPKPFVVELKRGARRTSLFDAPLTETPMSEALRQAERALFSGEEPRRAAQLRPPEAAPKGRILPSLIEPAIVLPETASLAAEDEPPAPTRRGRPRGSKNKPKIAAPATVPASAEPPEAEPAPFPPQEAAWGIRVPEFSDDAPELPEPAQDPTDHVSATAAAESSPGGRKRLRERSSILARYVYGTEPLPGERWRGASERGRRFGRSR